MDPERLRRIEALYEAARGVDMAPPLSASALRVADTDQAWADNHERALEARPVVTHQGPQGTGQ